MNMEQLGKMLDLASIAAKVFSAPPGIIDEDTFEAPISMYLRQIDGKVYAQFGSPPIKGVSGAISGIPVPPPIFYIPGLQGWAGDLTIPCEFKVRIVRGQQMKVNHP